MTYQKLYRALRDVAATLESTPADSLTDKEIMELFRNTIGVALSSLGDDTIILLLLSAKRNINEITGMYENLTSWVVEATKSLASRLNVEYLREQSHAMYLVDYKCFNTLAYNEYRKFIALCKPAAHVGKTWAFAESLSRISKLVDEMALIFQTYNLNLYPRLDLIIDGIRKYKISQFDLFIDPVDYVPIYNEKAWTKAGRPKGSSKYSVRIKSLNQALEIAGKEANWYTENVLKNPNISGSKLLLEGLGISWTKANMDDYDALSSFQASRLARYLNALRTKDQKLQERIIAEVSLIDSDFYKVLNGLKGADESDVEESSDLTLFAHSRSI